MPGIEMMKCGNCGAPIPADSTGCEYCESGLIIKKTPPGKFTKFEPVNIPMAAETRKSGSKSASIASLILGIIMAYLSYSWVKDNPATNKILLILAGPVALVFLLIGICNLFPKFRGIGLIVSGLLLGIGSYWVFHEFLADLLIGILVYSGIGLVLIIIGFGYLKSFKRNG